jgi:hypothetical protein
MAEITRREFLRALGIGAGVMIGGPVLNLFDPKIASADSLKFNPFVQPIITDRYYGSGHEINVSSIRNVAKIGFEDLPDADMMNVDGSYVPGDVVNERPTNVPSVQEGDAVMLESWQNGAIDYLPGHWNSLQTRQEREDWVLACNAVDDTHTIPFERNKWVSGQYATRKRLAFHGFKDSEEQRFSEITLADYKNPIPGRFNIPVVETMSAKLDENGEFIYENGSPYPQAHGLGLSSFVGDYPLNYWDWLRIEAQAIPGTELEQAPIGSQSIPLGPGGAYVGISFPAIDERSGFVLTYSLGWTIDKDGVVDPIAKGDTHKIMAGLRPTITAIRQGNERPQGASIERISPNPFNTSTKINYGIENPGDYTMEAYNHLGQSVVDIFDGKSHRAGIHETSWQGRDDVGRSLASGPYIIALKRKGFSGRLEGIAAEKVTILR